MRRNLILSPHLLIRKELVTEVVVVVVIVVSSHAIPQAIRC